MSIVNNPNTEVLVTGSNYCLARLTSDPTKQCKNKIHFSNALFCGIHSKKDNVLRIDEPLECNYIAKKLFNKKKYSKLLLYNDLIKSNFNYNNVKGSDIIYTLNYYKQNHTEDKYTNFQKLNEFLRLLELYKPYKDKIIIIQKCIRNYMNKIVNKLRGPGLFKRYLINNDTDFLTFEECINIPNSEFFSYKDTDNFIYGFNIKSIKYLIENNQKNPYNRNNFTIDSIENLNKLIEKDEKIGKDLSIKFNLHETPYNKMKNKCVKIFQRMDELELYTQPRWFLDLNIFNLRKLYMEIEDIWNYRAMLNNQMKLNYTTTGKAFLYSVQQLNRLEDKLKIQNIILNEFEKFAFEGKTKDDCITSCYWILTGLTIVSLDAAAGCPELVLSNVLN